MGKIKIQFTTGLILMILTQMTGTIFAMNAFAVSTPPDFEDLTIEKSDNPDSPDNNEPPTLTLGLGSEDIILAADAYPKGFNPLTSKTKIEFKLSKTVIIELKIVAHDGTTIVTIIDDEEAEKGEWHAFWEGTKDNTPTGDIVGIGTYKYVINAKDDDGKLLDSAEGELNIVYNLSNPGTPSKTLAPQGTSGNSVSNSGTVSLQGVTNGTTSETGPGVLLYFLFPFAGLVYSKIRK